MLIYFLQFTQQKSHVRVAVRDSPGMTSRPPRDPRRDPQGLKTSKTTEWGDGADGEDGARAVTRTLATD